MLCQTCKKKLIGGMNAEAIIKAVVNQNEDGVIILKFVAYFCSRECRVRFCSNGNNVMKAPRILPEF